MDEQFARTLARYADVAVRVGTNLQPGQELVVFADVLAAPLVREVVRSAYEAGAPYVHVIYGDEQVTLNRFRYAPRDSFGFVPEYMPRLIVDLFDQGAASLNIFSADPNLLEGQDPALITQMQQADAQAFHPVSERITRSATNWAVVAAPTAEWAATVFPDLPQAEQQMALWDAIFATCRIDQPDPVAAWKTHIANLATWSDYLNTKRYHALHYSGPGTDLTIGLADGHYWISGAMANTRGTTFVANLPTEEVFTMPHRERVDGVVRATKPLNIGGNLIEDFSLRFEAGRIVEAKAAKNEQLLRDLIATDEGAARLGEVALVPESSPIARSGRLFYNTLFDENAASHIALGESYRFTMSNGLTMDNEAYAQAGGNSSIIHTDFMIGSREINVDGIHTDNTREPLMRKGEWVF